MKHTNTCSKCHSNEIVRIPSFVGANGNSIKAGITVFLCTSCGYSEEWIDDPTDIKTLKKYYTGKNN
ncbi:hypothetical protein SDC9_69758 [bioreactor metagenome]|uniref:TFIIS-type domain-containing protein n=1 Tax=bioreactor metagenome TaxID=1076179 RepID=A0A644Y511_9ZZZZ